MPGPPDDLDGVDLRAWLNTEMADGLAHEYAHAVLGTRAVSAEDYRRAADLVFSLADEVEAVAAEHDMTPAEVAARAGVSVSTVLALHDGRLIAQLSIVRLLRWLADPHPQSWRTHDRRP